VEGRGGYRETTRRGTRNAHNNQTDHAEGGIVGDNDEDNDSHNDNDDDDDDDDDDVDDNDDDGGCGCGGWDGHHRMRKGRGHYDTTIKRSQRRGGKMVATAVTMTMTTTMMKPRSDRGCGGGEWRAAAKAVAVVETSGCFGMIIWHPR